MRLGLSRILALGSLIALAVIGGAAHAADSGSCVSCDSPLAVEDILWISELSKYVTRHELDTIISDIVRQSYGSRRRLRDGEKIRLSAAISSKKIDLSDLLRDQSAEVEKKQADSTVFLVFGLPSNLGKNAAGDGSRDSVIRVDTSESHLMSHSEMGSTGKTRGVTLETSADSLSVEMSVRLYEVLERPNLVLHPVSLRTNESVEETVSGINSRSSQNKNSQMIVDFREMAANPTSDDKGQVYVLPLVVRLKNLTELEGISDKENGQRTSLVSGVQGAVPVENSYGQAGVGVFTNLIQNRELTDKFLLSLAAGIGINIQNSLGSRFRSPGDLTDLVWNGNVGVGITCIGDSNEKTSLFLTFDMKDPLTGSDRFITPEDLNQMTPYAPMGFDSGRSVGVALSHQKDETTLKFECRENHGDQYVLLERAGPTARRDFYCAISASSRF